MLSEFLKFNTAYLYRTVFTIITTGTHNLKVFNVNILRTSREFLISYKKRSCPHKMSNIEGSPTYGRVNGEIIDSNDKRNAK